MSSAHGHLERRPGWVRRSAPLAPLAAVLALPLVGSPATAAPPPSKTDRPVTGSYSNPLEPVIPGDGTVDSCADPTVLKGQDGEMLDGQQVWYLYCSTAPLDDQDLDAAEAPVPHRVPMMVSTDLVDWTYGGDALPLDGDELPAWIDANAAFWAPEVVRSSVTGRYYLFVTVTETTPAGGGSDFCRNDSAIGVAVGDSPTGPWVFSDQPVVQPRHDPSAGDNPCAYFWTFHPDVLGDTVTDEGLLYYGSYYGGMHATPVRFTDTGVTTETAATTDDTHIAVADRYEGANAVFHDGFYYLFASSANCCNGALTGYSVFVGRSEDPLGPFVDREGNSFLQANVGGTPFLTQNGNRWVGTGHSTAFVDEGGQWWTIYHAVDQQDPFFAADPGRIKQPALLDPVDWVGGWPMVNGGAGASDRAVPAPAGQEGQRSRHRSKLVKPQVAGRQLFAEEFTGASLDPRWSWLREDAAEHSVAGGVLRFAVQQRELFLESNDASVLVRDAPAVDYVVETKVRVDVPAEGCCHNFAQGGLVIYADDDHYIKLASTSIWETRQTVFAKELSPMPEESTRHGNTLVGPPGEDWTWLRVVVEQLSGAERREAGGDAQRYTAYTSQDGGRWVRGGVWTHSLGADARIGLLSLAAPSGDTYTAEFDHVRVYALTGGSRPRA